MTIVDEIGARPAQAGVVVHPGGQNRFGAASRRFAGKAFWTVAGSILGKASGFAFIVLVARGLGAEEYGHFNFALSFVALFLLAGSYAIEPAVIREIARSRNRLSEVFASGLLLRGALVLAGFGLAVVLSPLFVSGGRKLAVVAVLGLALCLDEITLYTGSVYKAFDRAALHGLAMLANRTVSVLLAVLVLANGGDILAVVLAYLAGSLGALAFAWIGLRRCFPPIRLRAIRRPVVRELLRDGAPMAVSGAFNAALFRVDIVLLQAISGSLASGYYGVAYRFFESFLFLSWSISDVTLPRLARAGRGPESGRIFQLGVAGMLALFLPLAVIAPFASEWIVTTVFSDAFRPAAAAVPWLAGAATFYGIAYTARVSSVALRRRAAIVWIAAFVLATNIAANLVVIPRYGFRGAAVVTLGSEVLEAVLLLATFARANGGLYLPRFVFAPVVAGGVTVAALLATGARDGAAALGGLCIYVAVLGPATWLLAGGERPTFTSLRGRNPGSLDTERSE